MTFFPQIPYYSIKYAITLSAEAFLKYTQNTAPLAENKPFQEFILEATTTPMIQNLENPQTQNVNNRSEIFTLTEKLLELYVTTPTVKQVTEDYNIAAQQSIKTLESLDACEETKLLGELFSTTDYFLKSYGDATALLYYSIYSSQAAKEQKPSSGRKDNVKLFTKNLTDQVAYVEGTRAKLDQLKITADTDITGTSKTSIETLIYKHLDIMEANLETTVATARTLQAQAIETIRSISRAPTRINTPLDGRFLAGDQTPPDDTDIFS